MNVASLQRVDIHIDGDTWVQFSEGCEMTNNDLMSPEVTYTEPPADWEESTCETCEGRGIRFVDRFGQVYGNRLADELNLTLTIPCPDCIDGLRRIAVTEPCETCHGNYLEGCRYCIKGFVTVAHVVQDWGPVPVEQLKSERHLHMPNVTHVVGVTPNDVCVYRHGRMITDITRILPPDVDPQTLLGQWARGGRVVRG